MMRSGSPPEARTRHKTELRRRSEENTTERLSAVHVTAAAFRLSDVRRVAGPPRDGATYTSSTPLETARRNAIDFPSGEKAGLRSPMILSGGMVTMVRAPSL